jgi:hypothetical protein
MRFTVILSGLFVYVFADIAVNHGAAVRGWLALFAVMVRSVG